MKEYGSNYIFTVSGAFEWNVYLRKLIETAAGDEIDWLWYANEAANGSIQDEFNWGKYAARALEDLFYVSDHSNLGQLRSLINDGNKVALDELGIRYLDQTSIYGDCPWEILRELEGSRVEEIDWNWYPNLELSEAIAEDLEWDWSITGEHVA